MKRTVDTAEIEKFSRIAAEWWDPEGPFRPLHRLNPVRMGYIRDRAVAHFGGDSRSLDPLKGLTAIDLGCGGGLVAEPLARMGATVTAMDADAQAVTVAKRHAAERGVAVDYLRLRAFPFNSEVESFLAQHKTIFVVEQNRDAQLKSLLILETAVEKHKLHSILHYSGLPISSSCVVDGVLAVLGTGERRAVSA